MKKLVFTKIEAQALREFLDKLTLKNKVSRLRNKLSKKLEEIYLELEEDRVALAKEHSEKNEKNEPITIIDETSKVETFKLLDADVFNTELNKLYNEKVSIPLGDFSQNYTPLFEFLDSEQFDMDLVGLDANRYDRLLNIWEESSEEDQEEKEKKPKAKKTKKGDE